MPIAFFPEPPNIGAMMMNKDLIIAFSLGILVGWGIFHFTAPKHETPSTEIAQGVSENDINSKDQNSPAGEVAPPTESTDMNAAAVAPNGTPMAVPSATADSGHRNVNLELTEDAVDMLEQSITELHQNVTVERDNEGWILHFDTPDNYFASIGLSNNDRIPFTQFEEMRQNPETQELASRIETILSNLEK